MKTVHVENNIKLLQGMPLQHYKYDITVHSDEQVEQMVRVFRQHKAQISRIKVMGGDERPIHDMLASRPYELSNSQIFEILEEPLSLEYTTQDS